MSSPSNLRYTKEHEWARLEDNGDLTIGITDHAQDALGDVVFVELPEVGDRFGSDDKFGVVESVKTVSDLYSPCSGEVVAVNEELDATPELVNESPYDRGWIIRITPGSADEFAGLMDAAGYDAFVGDESN